MVSKFGVSRCSSPPLFLTYISFIFDPFLLVETTDSLLTEELPSKGGSVRAITPKSYLKSELFWMSFSGVYCISPPEAAECLNDLTVCSLSSTSVSCDLNVRSGLLSGNGSSLVE